MGSSLRMLLAAGTFLAAIQSAHADECSEILRDGAFDTIFKKEDSSTWQQLNEWLETRSFEEVNSMVSAGVTFPIQGFPVGANFNKQSFEKFQLDLKEGKISGFDQKSSQEFVEKNASPLIVDAWVACVQAHVPGVHLSATVNPTEPSQISVAATFIPFDETTKWPTVTSFVINGDAQVIAPNPFVPGAAIKVQPLTANVKRNKVEGPPARYPGVTFTINTTPTGGASKSVPAFDLTPTSPPLNIQIFPGPVSASAAHPEASAQVPAGFKLIGGGARVNWNGVGNLLTASWPADGRTWRARAKDHSVASPATIQAWAIGLSDPKDEWDVQIFKENSDPAAHPEVKVKVPSGFAMTGGGAVANWTVNGSLLTASYPVSENTWMARSKDHSVGETSVLTGYAIGIRPRNNAAAPTVMLTSQQSAVAAHPTERADVAPGFALSGGGAEVLWSGAGNLLTASFPEGNGWRVASKDHGVPSPAKIVAYTIGVKPTKVEQQFLILKKGPKSFTDQIEWVAGTYYSPSANRRLPVYAGRSLSAAFLKDLRSFGAVTNARIRPIRRLPIRRPR